MHGRRRCSLLAVSLLILWSTPASWGQISAFAAKSAVGPSILVRPQLGGTATFPRLARAAGTIFAGTVTGIERAPATGGTAVPTVSITFRVEHTLRGAVPGASFTVLEWLGLWSSGQRYAVGEHVLLFLYPSSKLGLTSAVGGTLGQFHLDLAEGILLSEQQLAAFQGYPLLARRPRIPFNDFAQALRQAIGEQEQE